MGVSVGLRAGKSVQGVSEIDAYSAVVWNRLRSSVTFLHLYSRTCSARCRCVPSDQSGGCLQKAQENPGIKRVISH